MVCKSQAEIEAEKIIAKQKAKEAAYAAAQAENDNTDIRVAPIEVEGEPKVEIEGLFFNEGQITKEDEPAVYLEVEKDVLDRSTGNFIGRFKFEIPARSKLVYQVFVDGEKVDGYGTNLPYMESSGVYDTILFRYPNSAKANKDGKHEVYVKAGVITAITESQIGLIDWGKVRGVTSETFVINLLPHKEE